MKMISKTIAAAAVALAVSFTASNSEAAIVSYLDNTIPGASAVDIYEGVDNAAVQFAGAGLSANLAPVLGLLGPQFSFEAETRRENQNDDVASDGTFTDVFTFVVAQTRNFVADAFFNPIDRRADPLMPQIENLAFSFNGSPVTQVDGDTGLFWGTLVAGQVNTLTVTGLVTDGSGGTYGVDISAVPLPPAAIAFGSALLGIGLLGRRRKAQ